MADQGEQCEKSCILHNILDVLIGSRQSVAIRRELILICELIQNGNKGPLDVFQTGSRTEGLIMKGSDMDLMFIDKRARVTFPGQGGYIPPDSTVLVARRADCRPGYVSLELAKLGQFNGHDFLESIVSVRDAHFISSEIFNRSKEERAQKSLELNMESHGPATTLNNLHSNYGSDVDFAYSFPCNSWPKEAIEWVSRPRFYGWPSEVLREEIVKGGCHVVPVGDKTAADTFLQWRISFTTAERKLVHSFNHVQFLVYGLLKYLLKQISSMFQQIMGDGDIISSYIMKTLMFYTIENTPHSLWQEQNTFLCFMICFKTMITLVKAGYWPNYFITRNNMFLGKVHGENQHKLLCFLVELYSMKWKCLSVGTVIQPSIGESMQKVLNGARGEWILPPNYPEVENDLKVFEHTFAYVTCSAKLNVSLKLLSKSKSDMEEFIAYFHTTNALSHTGVNIFGKHIAGKGNKEKYKILRKSKNFLKPQASVCRSPGLLVLATYHYQTGNYRKALEMCGNVISSFNMFVVGNINYRNIDEYGRLFSGRGYTLLYKCMKACASIVYFRKPASLFCPSQLHPELTKDCLRIPPLPYAVFLSVLCYHELWDTRRRDTAMAQLETVKYDKEQGGGEYWIVHNLLGICYEMVGDTRRATREYKDSLSASKVDQRRNPAMQRKESLQYLR
ncbi:uncharacterized protein LOC110448480 [Mizuhopecten yessoensis]|uniref:Cyclic GMP-AMP synthase n=1 Tax=Mizuhopecten yessoensis TaxID=6573 RepID=A0A210QT65_MIZYE|nr:uncharacterized protein LOC110448480 [Mizuhopecten yessoensis]OWF51902.1 Cyclic GMP-AMP synthase [Mizuhopecten yessoensis]